MTPVARALAATTGDPTLKLVLLCVAVSPGWPAVNDVAEAAEIPGETAAEALRELSGRCLITAHVTPDGHSRYSLPDDDWSFTRADTGDADRDDEVAVRAARALRRREITGASFTGRTGRRDRA